MAILFTIAIVLGLIPLYLGNSFNIQTKVSLIFLCSNKTFYSSSALQTNSTTAVTTSATINDVASISVSKKRAQLTGSTGSTFDTSPVDTDVII